MQTLAIQSALLQRGFSLGRAGADGIWGRDTIAGLRRFQANNGLNATGVMDKASLDALFGQLTSTPTVVPAWYAEASRLKGLHEAPGAANNPTILGWARALGGWVANAYRADSTPWCALFVSHCIAAVLPEEPLPSNPLSALAYLEFGTRLPAPAVGALCVFTRAGGGHVAFYVGEDETTIHTLGGNQSDAVTITRVPRRRLSGYRWPKTAPLPTGGRVVLTASGDLSRNEA